MSVRFHRRAHMTYVGRGKTCLSGRTRKFQLYSTGTDSRRGGFFSVNSVGRRMASNEGGRRGNFGFRVPLIGRKAIKASCMPTRIHATTMTANGSVRKNVLRSVACIITIPQRSQPLGAERARMRNTRPRNQASRNDLTEIIHPRRAVLPAALPMPQIMLVKQKRREMVLSVIFP